MMRLNSLRWPLAFVLASLLSLAMAEVMRPTVSLAQREPRILLKDQIPTQFGSWSEVRYMTPVLPDPSLQARLDQLYTQVLARTYRSQDGRVVMLSIAYGSDQSSEATAVHRPEFCYTAQGFVVDNAGKAELPLPGSNEKLTVQRLLARQGTRVEPISYWVTLDNKAVLPGVERKLTQLQFGLQGQIPDGMLVRLSTLEGAVAHQGYQTQDAFARDLFSAMDARLRERYFGRH